MTTSELSFRRLLLIGLFGVTFPVLVIGVYMTYIKASSEFLKNTQDNLTESAGNKVDTIKELIQGLKINLVSISESATLKLGSPQEQQQYIEKIAQELPTQPECIQLKDAITQKVTASTCENELINKPNNATRSPKRKKLFNELKDVDIKLILPSQKPNNSQSNKQVEIIFNVPVYNLSGELKSILTMKADLLELEKNQRKAGSTYWIIFDEEGIVIAHPLGENIGKSINKVAESELLKKIMLKTLSDTNNNEKRPNLISINDENEDFKILAGYGEISNPINSQNHSKWIVVGITNINSQLGSLEQIHRVLLLTMTILFILQVVLMVYLARTLGRPIDTLKDYALHIENFQSLDYPEGRVPQNFSVKEFNQLSQAFEQMLTRLKDWGKELEKAWERTKNANELKDMFLATISHELRTPLNGIMGSIELVKENFCDSKEEEKEFLGRAHKEACRLLDIIDDILDISKIQEGKLSVTIEPVDLVSIIKDVIENYEISIKQKGLELKTPKFQETIIVYGDGQRLRQVLVNVIGNAAKFTEAGSITLTVQKQEEFDLQTNGNNNGHNTLGENLVITILDTGIGIDPAQQSKLFRPFVMVDGSTTRKYRGSGLGLAISKFLMEEMGGSIQLHSDGRGKGTRVEIILPLSEAARNLNSQNGRYIQC